MSNKYVSDNLFLPGSHGIPLDLILEANIRWTGHGAYAFICFVILCGLIVWMLLVSSLVSILSVFAGVAVSYYSTTHIDILLKQGAHERIRGGILSNYFRTWALESAILWRINRKISQLERDHGQKPSAA